MRLLLAFKCFFLVLFARRLPDDAVALLPAPAPEPAPAPVAETKAEPVVDAAAERTAGAVSLLGVLQREGRLLDFLQENIDGYSDAQIGAAVRDIHRGCKKALAEHAPLEPVLDQPESATVRVDVGFDPARIKLVGHVVGEPPFTGTLRHHGWRAAKLQLPVGPSALLIAPAEVELS